METKSVELWESYVGEGAPDNAAGRRSGLGWTKADASATAAHWANQAPWERFRRATLRDHPESSLGEMSAADAVRAMRAFGWLVDNPRPSRAQHDALQLYVCGMYASAWLLLYPPPAQVEP